MTTATIEVPEELVDFLYAQGLTPEQVLTGFAHDLAETRKATAVTNAAWPMHGLIA